MRSAWACVVIGGVLALSGCAASVPSAGALAVYPVPDAVADALLQATVHITAACVWVEAADGDAPAVPVFPVGSARLNGGVLTFQGQRYRDGDTISLGGGFAERASPDWYIPKGCPQARLFATG